MKKLIYKNPPLKSKDGSVHVTIRFSKGERAELMQYFEREMERASWPITLSAFVKAVVVACVNEENDAVNLGDNMANEKLGISVERFSVTKNGDE